VSYSNEFIDWQDDIDAMSVFVADLVVATPESADLDQHHAVSALLERIRSACGIYAVFVAQSVGDEPTVRFASLGDDSRCDPVEEAYGRRVLESRPLLRKRDATPVFHALPVTGRNGSEYGTLCCRGLSSSGEWGNSNDRATLRSVARLLARTLEGSDEPDSVFGAPLALRSHQAPAYAMAA